MDAFNGEATAIIEGVSFSNFEASARNSRPSLTRSIGFLEATGFDRAEVPFEMKVMRWPSLRLPGEAEEKARQEQAGIKR